MSLEMLKASALSAISFVTISLKRPAKICHHSRANISLVPIFNEFNVFVKSLTVLIADISIVFRKKTQVRMQKVHLQRHSSTHFLIRIQHFVDNFFAVDRFALTQKILHNQFESFPCGKFFRI